MKEKIEHAKDLIREAIEEYGDSIAVGCSWGKDSMVLLDLALKVKPDIPIFSILTIHKPSESFDFAVNACKKYHINPKIYMVADEVPNVFKENNMDITLLPLDDYKREAEKIKNQTGEEIYFKDPHLCCELLKVVPIQYAYGDMNLQAWFSGLRNTEGHSRRFVHEIEVRSEKEVKINPILTWTEEEVWQYTKENDIPVHPWYNKEFPDGRKIRSLGCKPCTVPVFKHESERDGRWRETCKKAGECGIHTNPLRDEA